MAADGDLPRGPSSMLADREGAATGHRDEGGDGGTATGLGGDVGSR